MSIPQAVADTALDGLALIAAGVRGDAAGMELMLATYGADEREELLASVTAHAAALTRLLAEETDLRPDDVIAAVARKLRAGAC